MERVEADFESLYEDLAGRFGALGRIFGQLETQGAARQLLEAIITGDPEALTRLIEPAEIPKWPQLGKCYWLKAIIERVVQTPVLVEVCVLRDDLNPTERVEYFNIAIRYGTPILVREVELLLQSLGKGPEIPPGPFLDELKARGLVMCKTEVKYDVSTIQGAFGKPERICL
jgi:hypothetical protein